MNTLIERLEALTGPCREVDALISDAIWLAKWGKKRPKDIIAEDVTASIDAAMSIVPDGWRFHSIVDQRAGSRPKLCWLANDEANKYASGEATAFAIALCIAILRAREATNA